jgi:catechol 2,3-dioxygenase
MFQSLKLTSLHLRVANLARSVDFYTRQLGFCIASTAPSVANLSVTPSTPVILTLTGDISAPPAPREAAGLFHAALLRAALGAWLQHAAAAGISFDGFSDHGVSEAIYLRDPDGNGLEFYCDRPRAVWPFAADGELAMTTDRLDVPALLSSAAAATATPLAGAHWGHLHLRVTQLDRSATFYQEKLGLAVTQSSYPQARFLAADGYHHHIALNTWGQPRIPRSANTLGLVEATFARDVHGAAQTFSDPDGMVVNVTKQIGL